MSKNTVRGTRKDEFSSVIDLINHVFRKSNNLKPTMQQEFPLLLRIENSENMRIIIEDEKVVADINFLRETIYIQGFPVQAASIGAVCTHEDYRGRGYSSLILDDVERMLYEEGVDIVLISGQRSLYLRRGCSKLLNFNQYTIKPKESKFEFHIEELREECFDHIVSMYNKNLTRFNRTYDEFKVLLQSATFEWGNYKYKKYVICDNKNIKGYIILRINLKQNEAEVVELFLNNQYVSRLLEKLAFDLNLNCIRYYVHYKDCQNYINNYDCLKEDYMEGSLKIINFESLMERLYDYYLQYISFDILNKISFKQSEEGYVFKLEDEEVVIKDIQLLNKIIFEGSNIDSLQIDNCEKLKEFFLKVYPLPFVWPRNLNYQ